MFFLLFALRFALYAMCAFAMANFFMDDTLFCYKKCVIARPNP
jgi:hypothetical protein